MAAPAEREAAALPQLPLGFVLSVFARLPADARLRCAEVSHGWCATVLDRSLWTRIDLSPASGVARRVAKDSLLLAAAARAGGQLAALDVSGCEDITHAALLAVATANAGALRELSAHNRSGTFSNHFELEKAEALLNTAPLLRVLRMDIQCSATDARRALRNVPPLGPLQMRTLKIEFEGPRDDGYHTLAADMAGHASLSAFEFCNIQLSTDELDVVVDAVLHSRVQSCTLWDCGTDEESAPALARLAGSATLRTLSLDNAHELDAAGAALLGNALRANSTLTSLTLTFMDGGCPAAAVLVTALTGHVSVLKLGLLYFYSVANADLTVVGAALGALVAADAPALVELNMENNMLSEDGWGPLVDALPRNTHLRSLDMRSTSDPPPDFDNISEAFARDRLLPAVRANMSLRTLTTGLKSDSAREAEALVQQRRTEAEEEQA
jgi:hypothetical protein